MTPEELALLCEARVARALATTGSMSILECIIVGLLCLCVGWVVGFAERRIRSWFNPKVPPNVAN